MINVATNRLNYLVLNTRLSNRNNKMAKISIKEFALLDFDHHSIFIFNSLSRKFKLLHTQKGEEILDLDVDRLKSRLFIL